MGNHLANPRDTEYVDHLLDLMQVLGPVQSRRMFGGWGIFLEGLMFGLVANNELYFKIDPQTLADYTDEGLQPFTYLRAGKRCALNYYQPPEVVFEDQQQLCDWGNKAIDVALRAAAAKRGKS
ncbi:MAG: TfoX/Sxy family protein [Motiliproteus sp.]